MNLRLAILVALFIPSLASAAIKNFIVNEGTVSNVIYGNDNAVTVFGGSAGTCTGSALATCDSCLTFTGGECNERNVHGSLQLEFSFTIDGTPPAGSSIILMDGATNISPTFASTVAVGTTLYVRVNWSQLVSGTSDSVALKVGISNGSDTSTFATDFSRTVTIRYEAVSGSPSYTPCPPGVDGVAGQGFCYFTATPGDEKIYFNIDQALGRGDVAHAGSSSGVKFSALRVYYKIFQSEPDFTTMTPLNSDYQEFAIVDVEDVQSGLSGEYVDGLTNDIDYMFMIATVDQAGNTFNFSPASDPATAPRVAKPQEVYGLLEKQSCFIATAAYGHQWDPQVNILRQFRNNYLLTNPVGTAFVKFYYAVSPPIANFIATNETLKAMVRGVLSPIVWLSEKMNQLKESKSSKDVQQQESHD